MKIKTTFLFILFLLISTPNAHINVYGTKPKIFMVNDQGWINLNPFNQPPNNDLHGVDFIDSQHGWAVGEWGLVLNTINGGQSWQVLQNHTIDFHLKAVDFINENDGWAVGEFGLILHSTDGGQIWNQQISDTTMPLNDVFFISDSVGWAVGFNGLILHTKDRGDSWAAQESPTQHELLSVCFVNENLGWKCGTYTTLLKTIDSGEHWIMQDSLVDWSLNDVDFVDSLNGWLLPSYNPEKGIFRTEDGGDSWQAYPLDGKQSALEAISDVECWTVGKDGLIKYTNNGGLSWYIQDSPTSDYLHDVCFIDNQTGWAVGEFSMITNTEDRGNNWILQNRCNEIHDFLSGTFYNEQKGWLVEGYPGRLCSTNNGGYNWEVKIDSIDMWFHEIEFIDSLNGWFLANNISLESSFWRTTDGGNYWSKKSIPYMWNLLFLDDTIGFGGGDSIYTTNDGGETWQTAEIQAAPYFLINDIYFVDGQHGWAVGGSGEPIDAGIIINTSDGGASWHTVQDPASVFGRAVYFTDTLCGYVVGSNPPFFNSVVMSTKDGGESWKVQYISDITGGSWINDVIFINDKTGWCIGDYGFIWYTENGGDNWQRIDSGTHADLHRIKFIDNGRIGYIFGDDNTLLKLDRSIISIDDKPSITSSLFNKLYQNYPNPFNLSTSIVFQLHNYSQIRISVVNVLGQEVCVLVDEKRTTGTYTIRWNASNYSSGIYFIKMQADNFLAIKKCILLK